MGALVTFLTLWHTTILKRIVPASREQIANHFLRFSQDTALAHNWGGYNPDRPTMWDINDETYINGIPLVADLDLDIGYLLEVVERSTTAVSYLVVVTTPNSDYSQCWEGDAGTFFGRKVTQATIALWATVTIQDPFHSDKQACPCKPTGVR